MRLLPTATVLCLLAPAPLLGQANACTDVATHQVRMIEAAPGVTIEALDWGGSGPPLVLLAGLGNTGHVFDEFAVHWAPEYRVVAITRRGYGASSHPADGYDADTRVADVVAVLDALGIARATVVGHSIAGDELSRLGVLHPERVSGLIYFDAFAYGPAVMGTFPQAPADLPAVPGSDRGGISVLHRQATMQLTRGIRFPLSEYCAQSAGKGVGAKVVAGTHTVDFAAIKVPALGLFAGPFSIEDAFPNYADFTPEQQRAVRRFNTEGALWRFRQFAAWDSLPRGERITIPGANHYIFLSNPRDVVTAMRAFLSRTTGESRR